MGDDDALTDGAIQDVLTVISTPRDYVVGAFVKKPERTLAPSYSVLFADEKNQLLRDIWTVSFVGVHIFPRRSAINILRSVKNGNHFGHLMIFYQLMKNAKHVVRFKTPLIVQESNGLQRCSYNTAMFFGVLLPDLIERLYKQDLIALETRISIRLKIRDHVNLYLIPSMMASYTSRDDFDNARRVLLNERPGVITSGWRFILKHPVLCWPMAWTAKRLYKVVL
jgi:hypothetical protein